MELVYSIIFLIIGYGFGSFSTGYVVGRMSGHNIQSEGSGNIGTTNALRTMGAKGGALTFAGDLLKAFIPTLLVRFVFCPNMGYSPELTYLMTLVIGLGVVIGHNFPFYLHFKGGNCGIGGSYCCFFIQYKPWLDYDWYLFGIVYYCSWNYQICVSWLIDCCVVFSALCNFRVPWD